MGIRVYENEDMFSDEDGSSAYTCSCTSCHNTSSKTASSATAATSECRNVNNDNNPCSTYFMDTSAYKDIVGNCKEVRIDENTSNLRIVGNNNRIRIALNTGDLIVIGNNTRLKIRINHGHIKYTGNDGRISLGCQSQQQLVDYIGCNGTLKICKSTQTNSKSKAKCSNGGNQENGDTNNNNNSSKSPNNNCKTTTTTTDQNQKLYCHSPPPQHMEFNKSTKKPCEGNRNAKPKEKSHSYGGTTSFSQDNSASSELPQWQKFNKMFAQSNQKSMPNLTTTPPLIASMTNCSREQPPCVVQTIGNIVIANAANICIAPMARNITTKA